jgi:hypothetical protein
MTFRAGALIIDSQSASVGGYRLLSNAQIGNGDSAPIVPGMPVVITGNNVVKRAGAASTALAGVDGIAFTGATPTQQMMMRGQGRLNLTMAEWDLVTGMVGGLLPGVTYYLGLGLGSMTVAAPDQPGESVVILGKALTPTSFVIEISNPLLL